MTAEADLKDESDVVEERQCATAEDFLECLSPQAAAWQPDPTKWIFRGHSKSSYELKAKAHRDGADFCADYGIRAMPRDANQPQWSIDADRLTALILRFGDALDAAGLEIPSPAPKLKYESSYSLTGDPPPDSMPLVALMQHLGLPTPWLDWTNHVRVAAYFAAIGAAKRKQVTDPTIDVWALRRDFVAEAEDRGSQDASIKLVTAPRATNVRLHAQGGVFTWLNGENAHATTVDAHVRWLANNRKDKVSVLARGRPVMRRLTLPASEARKLLRLLFYEGVSAASVFPGYEGVVEGMKESAYWDVQEVLAGG